MDLILSTVIHKRIMWFWLSEVHMIEKGISLLLNTFLWVKFWIFISHKCTKNDVHYSAENLNSACLGTAHTLPCTVRQSDATVYKHKKNSLYVRVYHIYGNQVLFLYQKTFKDTYFIYCNFSCCHLMLYIKMIWL